MDIFIRKGPHLECPQPWLYSYRDDYLPNIDTIGLNHCEVEFKGSLMYALMQKFIHKPAY